MTHGEKPTQSSGLLALAPASECPRASLQDNPFRWWCLPLPWAGVLGVYFLAWRGSVPPDMTSTPSSSTTTTKMPPLAVDTSVGGDITASFAITNQDADDGRRATFAVRAVRPGPALEGTLFGLGPLHSRQGVAWAKEALLGALKREGQAPKVVNAASSRVLVFNDPLVHAAKQRAEVWLRMRTRYSDGARTSPRLGVFGDVAPRYGAVTAAEARDAAWIDAFRHPNASEDGDSDDASASADAVDDYELRVFAPAGETGDDMAMSASESASYSTSEQREAEQAATTSSRSMQWAAGPLYPLPWLTDWAVMVIWPQYSPVAGVVQTLDRSSTGALTANFIAPRRLGGATSASTIASTSARAEVWACTTISLGWNGESAVADARARLVTRLRADGFAVAPGVVRVSRGTSDDSSIWRRRCELWVRLVRRPGAAASKRSI